MFAIAFPTIDPVALELGPILIRWYSLAYIAGILLGWQFMLRLSRLTINKIDRKFIDDFIIWATLGIILGGRIGYVIFYKPAYFMANPLEIFVVWQGGMSFHGGLIGMLIVTWLFTYKNQLEFIAFGDLICAAAPIGLFFGRIANFINGELFGRTTDVPWGIIFPKGGTEPRHPSQLYEAGLEGLILFLVLLLLIFKFKALKRPGIIAGTFMIIYGLSRYFVEFFRQPDEHLGTIYEIATMGQILSVPLILLGIWLIHRLWRQS
jgi:phosphatidylglycerol:prolipoprotein diacylglycerol transferase